MKNPLMVILKSFLRLIFSLFLVAFFILAFTSVAKATVYEVGPGKQYARIIDCPTHNLSAGDIIKVYYKSTPYREKFMLHGIGTANQPIQLIGIPDAQGNKPILDGQNAVSSTQINCWNEDRQIIKVGQNSTHLSDHIIIDGFVFRNANGHNTFTNDTGSLASYGTNACAVRPEYASHITLRNSEIYNNGNGLFNGVGSPQHFIVEHCHVYNNGVVTPNDYHHHNIYMGAGSPGSRTTIQYCRFGDMLNDGQQCKFRTETTVFRFNWVDGGYNSQLDIVESTLNGRSDAYVYGNVIIKPAETHNARMVHFGGDQSGSVRNGTLYFYNNTCIIRSEYHTITLFQVSRSGANVVANNNIFYKTTDNTLKTWRTLPNVSGNNNWIPTGTAEAQYFQNSITGTNPGFTNAGTEDFTLGASSPCLDVVSGFSPPSGYPLLHQYTKHLTYQTRPTVGNLDLGAFERNGLVLVSPNGGEWWKQGTQATISWTANNITGTAHLRLIRNSAVVHDFGSVPVENGSLTWNVPADFQTANNYRVRINVDTAIDYSDNQFGVLALPQQPDFNSDSKPDLVLRNYNHGFNQIWTMNGQTRTGSLALPRIANTDWLFGGVGDFNGDGNPDILLRDQRYGMNQVWLMDGAVRTGYQFLPRIPDTGWQVAAVADFNKDDKPDILLRNYGSGSNLVWFMNGTTKTGQAFLPTIPDTDWRISCAADINLDGSPDLLLQNRQDGRIQVWYMNGHARTGTAMLPTQTDTNYRLELAADFNNDGKWDLLFRHLLDGTNKIWFMNLAAKASEGNFYTIPDTNWKILN